MNNPTLNFMKVRQILSNSTKIKLINIDLVRSIEMEEGRVAKLQFSDGYIMRIRAKDLKLMFNFALHTPKED